MSSNEAVRAFIRRLVSRYGVKQTHLARLVKMRPPQFNKWLHQTSAIALNLDQMDALTIYCARFEHDVLHRPYALKRPATLTAEPLPETPKTKDPPPAELPRRSKVR